MTCSRGCCETPQEHWRSLQVNMNMQAEARKNKELALYKKARDEGSLPAGTTTQQSRKALDTSDKLGRPYRADNLGATYYPETSAKLREWTDKEKKAIRENAGV